MLRKGKGPSMSCTCSRIVVARPCIILSTQEVFRYGKSGAYTRPPSLVPKDPVCAGTASCLEWKLVVGHLHIPGRESLHGTKPATVQW